MTTTGLVVSLLHPDEVFCCMLAMHYPLRLEREYIKRAVTMEMFNFLHYLWVLEKNFVHEDEEKEKKESKSHLPEKEPERLSYKELFDYIIQALPESANIRIKEISDWRLSIKGENMLLALCQCNMDAIACSAAPFYPYDASDQLFNLCIDNENEVFMKYALQESLFDLKLLEHDNVISNILTTIEKGQRLDLCFNVLTYANFSKWSIKHNKKLVYNMNRIVIENDENNIILLTSNTLMSLAH